jgi:nucleotidyltransferase-like protein
MSHGSEVWLFGSVARGDTDSRSDVDVLVAGVLPDGTLECLPYARDRLSIVQYGWDEVEHMAAYGSLFLHHLRLEGRPALGSESQRLRAMLEALPPYLRAERELASFEDVLEDVERSVARDHAPAFELSVVATALRHACILGCYAIGQPTFGRASAFRVFLSSIHETRLIAPAQRLYEFRLHEDGRGAPPFEAKTEHVTYWIRTARKVIAHVKRNMHGIHQPVS